MSHSHGRLANVVPLATTLTEKLGPLPVWAWGGIAGATIAGVSWIAQRRNPTLTDTDTTTGTGPATGTPAPAAAPPAPALVTEPGSFYAGPAAGVYTPPTWTPDTGAGTGTGTPSASSNDEWTRVAAAAILARTPSLSALAVTDALDAYVSGRTVTEPAAAIIELGVRLVGLPPYPVPPVTIAPPGTPPTVTPPTPAPAPPAPAPVPTPEPPAPTPAPPAPTPAPPAPAGSTLRRGDSGPEVRRLQAWLNGSTGARLATDGQYGPRTETAVANFQRFMTGSGTLPAGETFGVWSARWWDVAAFVSARNGTPAP